MQTQNLKAIAKRSKWSVIGGRIAAERGRDLRRAIGHREAKMGNTHRDLDLSESLDYIDTVFDDYLQYGPFERGELDGLRVLELGSGDNFGVALRFAAAGASVATADRFIAERDPEQQRRIYAGLLERLDPTERERLAVVAEAVAAGGARLEQSLPLEINQGLAIEQAPAKLGDASFDLIISRAVLEHVFDLEQAFDAMDALLRPGGWLLHKVDLRDHGLFTDGGQHPLTFLTIPDRLYRLMGEETAGLPNRRLDGWYHDKLERLGYEQTHLVTHLAGVEAEIEPHVSEPDEAALAPVLASVEQIRPRLLPRYAALPGRELAIAGFFLAARKPENGAG